MKAHDAVQTLAAGGIAPTGAAVGEERTSPVRARTYSCGGTLVVRLEPDAVAAGSDAEMAAFGCGEPEVSEPLGQVRFRTLGFPAWALVHGPPKVAAAALGVADELREAKQLALSRPGAAKEAFEDIAEGLTHAAPVLLPTFWEEAGRAAAEAGSTTLAAQCFERARQAERAHGLARDPGEADAVFVEFALLGALAAKTLSQYAKDLVKEAGGAEAYRRFRAIIIKRAFGGMPPYSGMGKDLAALAKAAKLDAAAEAAALARELLDAPGVARAPVEFWTAYRDAIVSLARGDAAVRVRLRAIWPDPRGGTDESRRAFRATGWVQLLDDAGALADLPGDDLGAWVSKLIRHAGVSPRVHALVAELAPRLAAARQPLSVVAPRASWGVGLSLDLAERALELGIPLADPEDGITFDPDTFAVDPVRVAREPRYGAKLVEAVAQMIGETRHERRMAGKAGFQVARRAWLAARLDELDGKPLPQIAEALELLEAKTTAEMFAPWPELHARLASIDVADGLAMQLRGGLADELAWPAYERALARLSAGGQPVSLGGAFPVLVMWNAQTALALDHTGVIAEHDLVYKPKDQRLASVWFLAGEFLVVLKDSATYADVAYWSSAPKQLFECNAYLRVWSGNLPSVFSLPDGRVSLGGKAFRPGDTVISGLAQWVADGRGAMWTREKSTFVPYDPARGVPLAGPPPPWVVWPRAGHTVYARQTSLQVAPRGLVASPLGLRDGMLGLRVRSDDLAPASHEVERIDGVRWSGPITPIALVDWPGDATPRPIDATGNDQPAVILHAPSGTPLATLNEHAWAARGWGLVPPAAFWHYLAPRDRAGSAALRAATSEQARALLGGVALPGVTDEVLMRGIAAHVVYAMELGARLAALVAALVPAAVDRSAAGLAGEAAQVRRLARALEDGRSIELPGFTIDMRPWLLHPRAMLLLAHAPIATAEARHAARELARALAGTVLADDLSRVRIYSLASPDGFGPEDWNTVVVMPVGGSVIAIHGVGNGRWAIELSKDGVFRGPPSRAVETVATRARGIGTAWTEAFLARPDVPLPFDATIRAALGADPAVLLYAGALNLDLWRKDFLGKAVRERLGLKVAAADAARNVLTSIPRSERDALVDAAVPPDPVRLAEYPANLGRVWRERFGARALPNEIVAAAQRGLRLADHVHANLLPMFAGAPLPSKLELRTVEELATIASWLYHARPVGDPLRAGIPRVIEHLVRVAADPATRWLIATRYGDDDAWRAIAGLVETSPALAAEHDAGEISVSVVPARLEGAARTKAERVARALADPEYDGDRDPAGGVRLAAHLRAPAFAAFADRAGNTPVPAGGYELTPALSVPKLVAAVAKAKKLPADAAALYLQILALAEPTQRDVCTWNDWTAKRYAEAAARLVKAKLVVTGKRERFGRSIFLRGPYTKGDRTNLPVEEAKLALYDVLRRHVPAEPAHLLFARAWKNR